MIAHSKPTIKKEELQAVNKILKSGQISQGDITRKFENGFSRYIGMRYGIAANSGTAALHLALLALKIKPKDEIIVPTYVCSAVLNAAGYVNASVKLVDIDPSDFNISIKDLKHKIGPKTKVIIVPHMFGMPADMDRLLSFDIPLIEDCALSLGATYKGKKVGSFGLISIFSFYATKLMTTGEGGMILTNDNKLANTMRDLREYDNKDNYLIRYNYKTTDLEAAMGLEQLKKLPSFIKRRQEISHMYTGGFSDLQVELPIEKKDRTHIYYRYVIKTKGNISYYLKRLSQQGIECKRPVYKPLHRYLKLKDNDFPGATKAYNCVISIPIYPSLENKEVEFIIKKIKKVFSNR